MKNIKRIAAATALTTGLGLAGLGAASVAEANPGPMPDYHWCPGQWWDPGWGQNWGWDRCHDDFYFDGEPRDQGHWHGYGPWHPDGPGGWGPGGGPGWGPPPPGPGW
ncbi:hypothetical protein [Mycobacterium sp.]|uniref:hypothetical protein n=1 Tax=Mycobacterium sp. TaxID=1785 RepID=UPI002BE156EA|nr:hypothetical protein [Mycobacterium sp.]HXB85462.1 hypothetical protein [Mycobacterium sp.]